MVSGIQVAQRESMGRRIKWSAIAAILLLPLVAMAFTSEIKWTVSDFVAAAALLVGGGLLHDVALARMPGSAARSLATAVIVGAVLLVWAQGAVGIF